MEKELNHQKVKVHVLELSIAIQKAIENYCQNSDCEITHAEINAALIDTLKSNSNFDLMELAKKNV